MREIRCSNAGTVLRAQFCDPATARSDAGEMRANNSIGVFFLGGGWGGRAPHAKCAQKTGRAEEPRAASGRFWSFPETLWSVPWAPGLRKHTCPCLPLRLCPHQGLAWWWPRWPGLSEQGWGWRGLSMGVLAAGRAWGAGFHPAKTPLLWEQGGEQAVGSPVPPALLSRSLMLRAEAGQGAFGLGGGFGGASLRRQRMKHVVAADKSRPAAGPSPRDRLVTAVNLGFGLIEFQGNNLRNLNLV